MKIHSPSNLRRRASVAALAFAASVAPATAQQVRETDSEVVALSAFTVSDTQGRGYVANDAVSGLKSRQMLIDIPQSIQVIPRDVIEDLGQFSSTIDTIKYASSGVIPFAYGEVVFQRGFRSGNPLIDGQLDAIVVADPVSYDSFEILKGPAAVLYGQRADLAGIIIKHTKKPLPVARHSLRAVVGEGGLYRGELDLTGPIGQLGNVPVSYRLIAAVQEFDGFQRVDFDNRRVVAGGLRFDLTGDTSLLVQADYFESENKGISNNFANAAGTRAYRGPGYRQGYKAAWSKVPYERLWLKTTLNHRFSDNWEMVSSLTGNWYERGDREIRNRAAPNFATGTLTQYFFGFDYEEDITALQTDVTGTYRLGGMRNQSSFGFSADRGRSYSTFWFVYTAPDTSIANPTTYGVPRPVFDATNRNNPNRGQRINTYGYYMHTLDVIEDRLSLVAGLSAAYMNTTGRDLVTGTTTEQRQDGTPRRLGIVYKPFDGVSLFVNNSTAFRGQGATYRDGRPFPAVEGEVTEAGVKTSLMGGRISTTLAVFELEVSNLPIPDFANPGFSLPAGVQRNRGVELDIAVRPLPNWSVVGSFYRGNIKGVDGRRMPNSVNESYSLLTRYDFTDGTLRGANVGASLFHSGDRSGGPWPSYTVHNLFAGYTWDRWSLMVNVDNVADRFYSGGGWGAFYVDIAPPRTFKGTLTYRF
jgi:iron complex outermembrane recepter protein